MERREEKLYEKFAVKKWDRGDERLCVLCAEVMWRRAGVNACQQSRRAACLYVQCVVC